MAIRFTSVKAGGLCGAFTFLECPADGARVPPLARDRTERKELTI
jgi:hypothetical protein